MLTLVILTGLGLATCILGICFAAVSKIKHVVRARRWHCKPVPSPDDFLGWRSFHAMRKARSENTLMLEIARAMNQIGKDCHTVYRRVLWHNILVTRDPENIKAALTTQVSHWKFGEARKEIISVFTGPSVLTSEGDAWKHSRALVRPQFSRKSTSDVAFMDRHIQALIRRLHFEADGWTPTVDLQPLFYDLTLDVITEFLYGQTAHSQDQKAQADLIRTAKARALDNDIFRTAVDQASIWCSESIFLGSLYRLVPLGKFAQSRDKVRRLVDWYVDRAVNLAAVPKSTEDPKQSRFVLLDELAKLTQDKVRLRDETLSLMLAGRGTTAALLGWVFYFLARNPGVFRQLRKAIREDFGTYAEGSSISSAQLCACHYLQNSISEALRLGAPVMVSLREAVEDTTLPSGGGSDGEAPIFVAKGTTLMMDFFNLHHRKDIWGLDAEDFKPERWDGRERNWEFVPFGGGARSCIGQHFAINEASLVVVRLLQRCDDLEPEDGTEQIRYHASMVHKSGTGVRIRLRGCERNEKGYHDSDG